MSKKRDLVSLFNEVAEEGRLPIGEGVDPELENPFEDDELLSDCSNSLIDRIYVDHDGIIQILHVKK